MKTIVFYFFFVVIMLFSGCQFDKLDPVTPDKTFEKIVGEQVPLYFPSMCLQRDGQIRILANAQAGLFPPAYTGVVFVINNEGDITWASDGLNLSSIGGGITPRDVGGYYYAVGQGINLGLNVMNEDGSIKSSIGTPIFSEQSVGFYFPAGLLTDFSASRIFVYGLTEYNDSLHVAMMDNNWDATSFVYNSAIHIPDMSAGAQGTQYCVQNTSDDALIVCGNGRLVKVKVYNDLFSAATWETVWDKAQPDANGISWVVETGDGGFLAVGGGTLLKTDASGSKQWSQALSGSFIVPTSDGNYLVTGSKDDKAYAAKVTGDAAAPSILWERTYPNGTDLERAVEAPDQGFYMIGPLLSGGLYFIKTDENGYVY